jgi:hypothetical protein
VFSLFFLSQQTEELSAEMRKQRFISIKANLQNSEEVSGRTKRGL